MKDDGLISILGNKLRAKIVRFVVMNPQKVFESREVMRLLRTQLASFNREMRQLMKDGIIVQKRVAKSSGKSFNASDGFILNGRYPFLNSLKRLVQETIPHEGVSLFRGLSRMRGIQVVIATGAFANNTNTNIDVLIVGDTVSERNTIVALTDIEKEYGFAIRYNIFDSNDFIYRLSIGDKILRNIFDYPHDVYLDSLGVTEEYIS